MNKERAWIFFIAGRFGSVDTKGRSAITSLFSVLGIAFGITALIVILSVMNGFQMGYIESILEVSSSHVLLEGSIEDFEEIRNLPEVRSLTVFTENQTLMQGKYRKQAGVLLRAVSPDILKEDPGFADAVKIVSGSFNLTNPESILLGYELARQLAVSVGDRVSLVAVSGDASTDLFPEDAYYTVAGLFYTGYYEIDNSFAYISDAAGEMLSGHMEHKLAGVKLKNRNRDGRFLLHLQQAFPDVQAESWRSYNRAFFGALQIEKNVMLLLVVLIFVVVTVNIYNSMRRAIYERREEISVLTALGGAPRSIQYIFIINGLAIGLLGGLLGLLTGLLISVRINDVFILAETVVNGINTFFSALFYSDSGGMFTLFSPDYFYMQEVPARILLPEVVFVFLFGVLSAAIAAWSASRAILKLKPAEVLRYE
ncbi:ABC transporter permease [Brucepastera parasyntrophica]|uniref:ABC transporter permease n=1 Tax=Brucepastera parasyntrophica TaxID=2880008 RepID=UPI00210C23A5|nr:ABC transporter permease [Brucepastera parasyntrophica]ULQ59935.1 ABC transporter permease [Brucepastera parasyntrophica]